MKGESQEWHQES